MYVQNPYLRTLKDTCFKLTAIISSGTIAAGGNTERIECNHRSEYAAQNHLNALKKRSILISSKVERIL